MLTVFLFDGATYGHHITYLKLFSKALLGIGCRVIVFSPAAKDLESWESQQNQSFLERFKVVLIQNIEQSLASRLSQNTLFNYNIPRPVEVITQWYYAAKTIKNFTHKSGIKPDLVFFPWLDTYLDQHLTHRLVDVIFPFNWSGLFFHPRHLLSGYKKLPFWDITLDPYSLTHSAKCRSIGFIDELEGKKFQRGSSTPAIIFPDLTDESPPESNFSLTQQIKEAAKGRRVVGLVGALAARKGLFTLLQAAEKLKERNDWFFAFVGKLDYCWMSPSEMNLLQTTIASKPSNCFFHLSWIPEERCLNAVIDSCDVLFAAYINFPYSSNILTKAAVFKKPVIVSDSHLMHSRIEKFQLGIMISPGNLQQCIEALNKLHQHFDPAYESFISPDFQGYRELHSDKSLATALRDICEKA
jgi:glycosyltransferase involved in cell wall biosynthesis